MAHAAFGEGGELKCLTVGVLSSEIRRCSAGCWKGKTACDTESM